MKPQQQQQQQQQSAPVLPPPPAVPSMLQKLMSEQLPPSLGSASNVNGPIMSAADLERFVHIYCLILLRVSSSD